MTIDFSKIWLGMENDWYLKNTDTSYPRYNIVEDTVAVSYTNLTLPTKRIV